VPAADPDGERPPPDPLAAGGVFDTGLRYDGRVLDVAEHRARLEHSVYELYQRQLPPDAIRAYAPAAGVLGWERQRIDVAPDGTVTVTRTSVEPPVPITRQPGLDVVTIDPATGARFGADLGFGRHKWVDRRRQDALERVMEATHPGCAVALADAGGRLVETTRANVFGVEAGCLVTAPLDGRILPGVTRTLVLDVARELGIDIELRAPDPGRVEALAVTGSVAALRWVRRCDTSAWSGPGDVLTAIAQRLLGRRSPRATVPS
jgi:para-aminobenzoate synthetase/4-amino-4-deoxychorismate lyase